jgi:chromosome segregation ATPase
MSDEDNLTELKQFVRILSERAQNAAGRMGSLAGRMEELAAAQANSEAKIAALADAQIRTETVVTTLGERMAELAAAQAHTGQRLDALIDIVRGMRQGGSSQS